MKNKIKRPLFKYAVLFFFGLIGFVVVVNAAITIPSNISNAIQVIQRLLITDDGTQSGNPIIDINSGGSVIVYGPLLDQNQTPFITGFTETDPLRSSVSNDYYTKNQVDAKGYLTTFTETDPIWISVAGNYYTKSQIDANGYLTSFTELDPIFGASVAKNITNTNVSNRNTAYSRGDHSSAGYLTNESDPVRNLDKLQYYSKTEIDSKLGNLAVGLTYIGGRDYSTGLLPIDAKTGDMYIVLSGGIFNDLELGVADQIIAKREVIGGTATGDREIIRIDITELDPIFTSSPSNNITNTNIVNRDSAYSRGDHGLAGYVTDETDPIRDADKTNYYTKEQIDSIGYLKGYTESDPIFTSSPANNITNTNLSNRNTAYSRGNHSSVGYLTNESDPQVGTLVAGKTCYASGGKIICDQDMAILSESDPIFGSSAAGTITNTKISNWDNAYSRGNHSNAGYLTTFTESDPQVGTLVAGKTCYASGGKVVCDQDAAVLSESDPIFGASAANSITNSDINNRDVAYGRGNHSSAGYLTSASLNNYYTQLQIDGLGFLTAGDLTDYYTKEQIDSIGYLTGYTESDPTISGHIKEITAGNITNRNSAYGRGNHNSAGYLTSATLNNYYTQLQIDGLGFLTAGDLTDYYTKSQIDNKGYITGYTESDPVFMANSGKYYLIANPDGYLTAAALSREKVGDDIINTNSGRVLITGSSFIMKSLNIGGLDSIYPLYVRSDNTDDIYSNYITIDGPDTVEKGFQIGGGGTSEDYKRAMYIDANDDGDKLHFANGNSERDIFTLAAGGRVGINQPTLLNGGTTPLDGFSIYPQYFDHVARYDGDTYYDNSESAYKSAGDSFTILSGANDVLLIGKNYPRRATYIGIDTPSGTPGTLIVKYSKVGGTWDDVVGLTDTTNRFKKNGNIAWSLDGFKDTREKRVVNGQDLYWIQMSLSSLEGSIPTARLITNLGVNRFSLYAAPADVSPMFTIDSEARLGILPPELTGKYQLGNLPGLTSSQMEIVSNSTLKNNIISYLANDESGAGYNFVVAKSKGSVDHKEAVSSEDTLGGIFGFAYDGATFRNAASIVFSIDGIPGVMDMPGKITFLTSPNASSTPVERMTIKSNGFVGIGTSNPVHTLTVNGHINVTSGYHVYDGNGEAYITSSDIGGHIMEELDPIRNVEKSGYYNKTQIDSKFSNFAGGLTYKGSRDYSTGLLPSDISFGDMYIISSGGNFNGLELSSPDQMIANTTLTGGSDTGDRDVIHMHNEESDPIFSSSAANNVTNIKISNRDTSYGRGNHATKGYLTGYTEIDPVFMSSIAKTITTGNISNRNSAYSRGNHASMGYITSYTETDPVRNAVSTNYYTKSQITGFGYLTASSLNNYYTKAQITGFGYITGYIESDPIFGASVAKNITNTNVTNRNSAYGRGNHSSAGYLTASSLNNYYTKAQITGFGFLTSFTESDPIFGASPANLITNLNITNRNSAYGRGNHSSAGYLTASSLNNYYTKAQITGFGYLTGYTETDPTVSGHIKTITTGNILNRNNAYTWMGINSGFAMHFRLNSGSYYTKAQIDSKFPPFQGRIYVSPTSQFTGLKQALDWIKVNDTQAYEIILSAGDHYISDTLSVEGSYPITIRGAGFEATSLLAAAGLAGKPMMVIKTPSELISLNLDASTLAGYGNATGEDGVVYSGGNGNYNQMNDVGIYSFNKAIYLADNSELRFFNSSMQDNVSHGLYISGGSARLTESEFFNTKSNITLFAGSGTSFSLQNSVLRTNAGQIGIQYFPTTYKNFEEMVINGNDFITASGGISKSGFDFTLKRDSDIEFFNNTNLEDYRPHASLNVYNGAITSSYTSNTWRLLQYNMSSIYAKKRTVSSSGRVTFLSKHTKSVQMFVNANLITTTNNARVRLAIIKNGNTATQYGLMEAQLITNNIAYPVGLNAYLDDVKENDYFEIYIYSVGATDTVGLTNLNWYIDSR